MPSRTKSMINPELDTRVSVLEQTVLMQNTATNKQLESISRVLGEIHDKVDNHLLSQAVKTTALEMATQQNTKDITRTNRRYSNMTKAIVSIIVTIIGGGFTIWAAYMK